MRTLSPFLLVLASCAAPIDTEPTSEALIGGASVASVLRGRDLFNHEEMGGNGRTCSSCHTTVERAADIGYRWGRAHGQTPGQAVATSVQFVQDFATFDLAPDFAARVFEVDPLDGLFVSIDSDRGVGADFEDTLFRGLVRVHITLHPSVHVIDCGPANECEVLPNGQHRIVVLRSSPTSLNTFLEESSAPGRTAGLMWDMRRQELADQAGGAFDDHFERTLTPTAQQLADIAAFERQTYTDLVSFNYAVTGADPGMPECHTASECRGMEFFEPQHITATDMAHRGLCAQCHSGPLFNHSSIWHKFQLPRAPFANGSCPCSDGRAPALDGSCGRSVRMEGPIDPPHQYDPSGVDTPPVCLHRVSAPNTELPNPGMAVRTFLFDDVPAPVEFPTMMIGGMAVTLAPVTSWGPRVVTMHDPGRGSLTGDPCNEFPVLCLFATPGNPSDGGGVGAGLFRIASLRGAGRRRHFDHNNNNRTTTDQCRDVALGFDGFVGFFQSIGDPDALAFHMTEQDIQDCGAYLSLL